MSHYRANRVQHLIFGLSFYSKLPLSGIKPSDISVKSLKTALNKYIHAYKDKITNLGNVAKHYKDMWFSELNVLL